MLLSGYALSTADRSTMNQSVKICQREIVQELEDKQLIAKAYNTLDACLLAIKESDRVSAAQVLLRFKSGDKITIDSTLSEEERKELAQLRSIKVDITPKPSVQIANE